MKSLAIVPTYNEEVHIGQIVSITKQFVDEVVVIDDMSDDNTISHAKISGASVIKNSRKGGYSGSIRNGLSYAIKNNFDRIVMLDGDGAHNPTDVPRLLEGSYSNQSDLVIASRFEVDRAESVVPTKRLANLLASTLVNKALGTNLQDVACGFRCITGRFAQSLLQYFSSEGFAFPYDMIAIATQLNFKIDVVSAPVYYDASELLYTKRNEFNDLLNTIMKWDKTDDNLRGLCKNLLQIIDHMEPMTILINEKIICVHPVKCIDGYIFQVQSDLYRTHTVGSVFTI